MRQGLQVPFLTGSIQPLPSNVASGSSPSTGGTPMTLKSLEKRVCKHHAACNRQIGYPQRLATVIPRVLGLWRQRKHFRSFARWLTRMRPANSRVCVCMRFVATCTMDPHILSVLSCRLQHQPFVLVVGCGFCAFGDNSQQHCIATHLPHVLHSYLLISLPHQQTLSRNVQKTKKQQCFRKLLWSLE